MIRVLVVDDQDLVRAGLRLLIDNTDDLRVVGEASDGREALALAREHQPDVVLMDLQMPVMGGVETTAAIRADPLLKDTPVVVLTTFDHDADVVDAVQAGASGYLLKDLAADELRGAIRTAVTGGAPIAPKVAKLMMHRISRMPSRKVQEETLAGLTARELDILAHVGRGLSNEEIGQALFLSPETARTYVSRLLAKLGVRDRSQLVVLAHKAGLVD
ncbi:two component transcriptional regulator, LuxR family [Kribbella flavida DSM 17836]|uniref:Two component transcriptional regulator, LuxR family n=1 Tax=Kribbella flavida (strain DSM 17836 / JCM 10339 / NBRC 14399) TaxID=479435 RepID=D2Q2Q8_KRIFD|nr:response regulator transcription factor [Kribbella flavida]ADB30239.1 two component transcriptional regulator, LuxR family [Kribbella flavida DSM 17836]